MFQFRCLRGFLPSSAVLSFYLSLVHLSFLHLLFISFPVYVCLVYTRLHFGFLLYRLGRSSGRLFTFYFPFLSLGFSLHFLQFVFFF